MASLARQNAPAALEILAETWLRELLEALPLKWRKRFPPRNWRVIQIEALANEEDGNPGTPIALSILPQDMLIRRIELPLVTRFRLSGLMRYEAPRHVPLPPGQARVDFRIVKRDLVTSRMLTELAIVRSEVIETIRGKAINAGFEPEALYLTTEHGAWFARRFFVGRWWEVWLIRRRQWRYLRVLMGVLLILGVVLSAQHWAERLAQDRHGAMLAARKEATGIEPLRKELAVLKEKLAVLAKARRQPTAVAIAEEVARLLPDNAWLQEMDIQNRTLRMVGITRDASNLLRIFSSSPFFTDVRYEAPLVPSPGAGGIRFDILLSLRQHRT